MISLFVNSLINDTEFTLRNMTIRARRFRSAGKLFVDSAIPC